MKRALLSAVFLLLVPGLVSAQIGSVCLFADQNGTDCTLTDGAPGVLSVYVIHTFVAGATAIQFSAPKPACMIGATWLGDTWPFPVTIGDSQTDVAVGYGACRSGSIHALTVNYAVSGTTTADCAYSVLPAVGQIDILTVDCDNNLNTGTSGTTFINSNQLCQCTGMLPDPPLLAVVPSSLDFGLTDNVRTLQISNVGGGVQDWVIFRSVTARVVVSPVRGSGAGTLTVTVDRTGTPPGTYEGVINVVATGGAIDVPVTMTVPRPIGIAGSVGAHSDADGINCDIQDRGPGMFSVFIVHQGTPGATATQFSAPLPACATGATWLSDTSVFPSTLGNSQDGVAVRYGTCRPAPVHVLTVHYFGNGTSAACCMYPVLPDPRVASGQVEAVDCGNNLLVANATHCVINPNSSCLCRVTPVEETTWGRVKAMYHGPGTSTTQPRK